MNNVKEKLDIVGKKILAYSRNEIYISMRFMDIALSMLSYEMNLSTKTIGIDGRKILYNPRYLIDLFSQDNILVNRCYMHMLLHGLFGHVYGQSGRDEKYWHLSCDIAVASVLDEMKAPAVKRTMTDFHRKVYDDLRKEIKVLNSESIYRVLYNTPISPKQFDMLWAAFVEDDHSFWKSDQNDDDSKDNQSQTENKNQWMKASEKVETGMETMDKEYGDMAGDLLYQLKFFHREREDYSSFLRKFTTLREEIKSDGDSFDYIFYTYGLEHYGNMPLIEPLEYKEIETIRDFVIVIDTSNSCDEKTVHQFLERTFNILDDEHIFGNKLNVHLLQCDVTVTKDTLITSKEQIDTYMNNFVVSGGGGTDFRPAFEYIRQLQEQGDLKQLKGLLYFTDGIGIFPAKAPNYATAFVFPDATSFNVKVPGWAMKVLMEEDGPLAIKE